MRKGEITRQAILDQAANLASRNGLAALSIGRLARETDLSKSGLFAHFGSKEALAVQVIDHTAKLFAEQVIRPALKQPRGEPRVRELFEKQLAWSGLQPGKAGCVFVALSTELDDHPGPARDRLAQYQGEWLKLLAGCFRVGIEQGHFRRDADPDQFAQDVNGVYLARHHAKRLLLDPKADERAMRAFETLIEAARPEHTTPRQR
jgi:AcrR family transcriptional regulator